MPQKMKWIDSRSRRKAEAVINRSLFVLLRIFSSVSILCAHLFNSDKDHPHAAQQPGRIKQHTWSTTCLKPRFSKHFLVTAWLFRPVLLEDETKVQMWLHKACSEMRDLYIILIYIKEIKAAFWVATHSHRCFQLRPKERIQLPLCSLVHEIGCCLPY